LGKKWVKLWKTCGKLVENLWKTQKRLIFTTFFKILTFYKKYGIIKLRGERKE
jgi:hypothetical protein